MFIFLEADSFTARFEKEARADKAIAGLGGKSSPRSVRRPYRGIQIKDDTYATLSVVKATGESIPLVSSSAEIDLGNHSKTGENRNKGFVDEYSDFIIQNLTDERVEKQQIIETFGQPYIYFFGERPRMVSFNGLLVNTDDFNWRSQFWDNYENHLRGTKLVQANARVYLSFDTILIEGYPLRASAQDESSEPYSIPFQMQMFVTNYYDFSQIGQTRFPGADQVDSLEVLNDELKQNRNRAVTSGPQIKRQSLEASGAGGILAGLRSGIKEINNLKTIAGDYLATASQVLGGRTVRVPVGIAGFLATTGEGAIAAGQSDRLNELSGSVNLVAPSSARFAPAWVSEVDGHSRGFIWENIDEYPNRVQPKTLADISSKAALASIHGELVRKNKDKEFEARIEAKIADLTGDGGSLQSLTERVAFAKDNFGMVMNAKAFVEDPVSVGKKLVGITSDRNVIEELQRRGIKLFPTIPGQTEAFIGAKALQTFRGTVDSLIGGADEGATGLGAAFDQGVYNAKSTFDEFGNQIEETGNQYEPIFGDQDFSALISTDSSTSSALTESFGDSDTAPEGSEIDPDSFSEVFGAEVSSPATPSPEGKAVFSSLSQTGIALVGDVDTGGIRGVLEDSSAIDPVI